MISNTPDTLFTAQFNPAIKKYLLWYPIIILCVFVITLPIAVLYLIIAPYFINKYYSRLHCELTTRSLKFNKGFVFRVEKTVPLDKIQDLTFTEGPLQRLFGLSTLRIETAGSTGMVELTLIGIVEPIKFRGMVLEQRDKVTGFKDVPLQESNGVLPVLDEIKNSLKNIEKLLQK